MHRGITVGKVLSDLARQTLLSQIETGTRNGLPLFPIQQGVVTPEIVARLGDEAKPVSFPPQ